MLRFHNSGARLTAAGCNFAIAVIWLLFLLASALRGQPAEYEVKAAFLLNFIKFVDWPVVDAETNAPIALCIVGDDPFGRTLDQIVEGETVADRKIVVHRVRATQDARCQLAFFSKSVKDAGKILSTVPAGLLTVGEGETFLRDGGMIAFVLENRRVRFDIDTAAIRNAGLRVSSRLLTVARSVGK